mmetsp:Transcript_52282/g.83265  ORF Transcript_52282/g.83265 Transcript_52282/m.83265 type:complete len:407 (-) Transcript_52282:94-1314(-)
MDWTQYTSYVTSVVDEIDDNPWTLALAIFAFVAIVAVIVFVLLLICNCCCKCCKRTLCKKQAAQRHDKKIANDDAAMQIALIPVDNTKSDDGNINNTTEKQQIVTELPPKTNADEIVLVQPIKRVLVTVLCISKYDGNNTQPSKLADLPNVSTDKKHMKTLWANKYRYDMVINRADRYTLADGKKLMQEAAALFADEDYECVIMIYSGHGDKENIYFSDYKTDHKGEYEYSKMSRIELTNYFDGNHVNSKADAYKLYFIDACRGNETAVPVVTMEEREQSQNEDRKQVEIASKCRPKGKVEMKPVHADCKRMMLWPNTERYMSFDTKDGGILLNSLYETLIDAENDNKSLGQLYDRIKKKGDVLVKNAQDVEAMCCVENAITMSYSELSTFRLAVDDSGSAIINWY